MISCCRPAAYSSPRLLRRLGVDFAGYLTDGAGELFGRLGAGVRKRFRDPRLQKLFSFQAMYAALAPDDAEPPLPWFQYREADDEPAGRPITGSVTIEYDGDKPVRVDAIIVSAQHSSMVPIETVREDVQRVRSWP